MHFSASGCVKWVWLVKQMWQRIMEKNCCMKVVTIRGISLELWALGKSLSDVESSKHVVTSHCCYVLHLQEEKFTSDVNETACIFFFFSSSQEFHTFHYAANWSKETIDQV